jgi:glycosyltransferase involved in cell wall biosynthesis
MQELRKLYNIADVSVVPSRREPFGLVALEAMACGIPVVASDQGGLPDFVNDSVGALAKPEDPADLAKKVEGILDIEESTDEAGWKKDIAEYARKHYAQDMIIKELEDVYRKAVSGC